ncbi:MAG: OFA family MFS transporter [Candidatus Methanogranum gryphiswaldense]|nr:MAG: OFA family MFS transporter [Candidatus Methanogranum sp. U3.2.1]
MSENCSQKVMNRYLVLAAGMVVQLCAGIIYMWSVFKQPVTQYLSWNSSSAALVTSIMMVAFVIGMVIGGKIMSIFGSKKTAIFGSIVMSFGILITAFVNSGCPSLIFLTYAIIGGLGVGIIYTCTVANVQKWFFDKRGFATGMMVGAFGFSMVIFAPVASYLLKEFGVPTTFEIFGIAFLLICVTSSFFLVSPPKDYTVSKDGVQINVQMSQKQYTTKEMLRRKSFYLIFLSLFFVVPAFFILNPLLKPLGMDRGLVESLATLGVMIVGASSAAGRLSITWLSDRIGRLQALLFIIVLTAVGIIAAIVAQGVMFLVCISIIGYAFGGVSGVYATVTADHFGTQNMGVNYGIVCLALGASSLVFTCINNALSGSGDYTASFLIAAATCVVSLILVLLLKREKNDQPNSA